MRQQGEGTSQAKAAEGEISAEETELEVMKNKTMKAVGELGFNVDTAPHRKI